MSNTYPEFFIKSAGRLIPLNEASWVKMAPCGCAFALVPAVQPDGAPILSEEDAFRRMQEKSSHPTRLMERYKKQGFKVTLVTEKKYIEVVTRALLVECPHIPKWGVSAEPTRTKP